MCLYRIYLSVLAACLLGCESNQLEVAPVRGRVTVSGKPLDHGTILFTPQRGRIAHARIQPDGQFWLSTYKTHDGAIVGPHKIAIFDAQPRGPEERIEFDRPAPRPTISEQYRDPEKSELTFNVETGKENIAEFDLRTR